MKHFILLFSLVCVSVFTACKDKNEIFPDLTIEKNETVVNIEESVTLKIISGSGEYDVKSSDEKAAKVTVLKDVITVVGISGGKVMITVTDNKSKQTAQVKVTVSSEKTLKLVSSNVEEFKKLVAGQNAQDIPADKIKDHWGERVADNTPAELQFKEDSLYIVKPNGIIEKYKTEWREQELYLYNKPSDTWRYCGKKIANNQFSLNTGFYSIVSKTEKRILRLMGQDYALKTYSDIPNQPNSSGIWLKITHVFAKK